MNEISNHKYCKWNFQLQKTYVTFKMPIKAAIIIKYMQMERGQHDNPFARLIPDSESPSRQNPISQSLKCVTVSGLPLKQQMT